MVWFLVMRSRWTGIRLPVESSPSRREPLAELRVDGDELIVRVDGDTWKLPVEEVEVVLDGPVLEVTSSGGMFGIAVRPAGDSVRIDGNPSSFEVHPLVR